MASYKIEWRKSAVKEFEKLPKKEKAALIEKILLLAKEPKPVNSVKLVGSENAYRIRQGNFRVVYQIDDGVLIVLIVRVAHRREVYK